MKLNILAATLIMAALFTTSCKREFTCSCYSPGLNASTPDFKVQGKKSDAKKECEEQPLTGRYTGTDYVCNLK